MSASDGGRSSKRSGNGWSRVKRWSANVPATYVEGTQMLTVDGAQQTAVVNPSWNRGYNPADCAWTREGGLKRHRTGDNNAEDRRLRHKSKMSTLCPKTEPLGSSNMPFDSEGIHTFDEGLLSFLAAVAPDEEAHRKARLVMHDVAQTLYNVGLQVALFGSWSTGLCIPSSDMDFAAVSVIPHVAGRTNNSNMFRRNYEYGGSCGMVTESLFASLSDPPEFKRERQRNYSLALRTVAKSMRSSNSFCRIVCIPHARVPLVKAVHSCGKAVDVSFQSDGLKTTAFLRDEFRREEFRRARGLIMLLKALLDKWELNDPSKNGLGSFPVSIMVLWFLREEAPKECTGESGNNYATQFVALLKYYGTQFDYLKEGIDYAKGCTFTKTSTELFIVNPLKPGANCASSATLFDSRVVPNLRGAYRDLLPLLKPNVTACLIERTLGRVFGVSQKALSRGKAMWKHRQDARAYVGGATAQHQWDELTNILPNIEGEKVRGLGTSLDFMFGELVCGPPGSGKTTYCEGKRQFLSVYEPTRPVVLLNLDPANEDIFPYPCDVDIREVVSHVRVMETEELGPNGSYLFCAALMERRIDWIIQKVEEAVDRRLRDVVITGGGSVHPRPPYLIIDCPGQVEFYLGSPVMHTLFRALQKRLCCTLCTVHLVDASVSTRDISTYVSSCLLSITTMIDHELPHINVFSKWDTLSVEDSEEGEAYLRASSFMAEDFDRLWKKQLRQRRRNQRLAKLYPTGAEKLDARDEPSAAARDDMEVEAIDLEKDGGHLYRYSKAVMEVVDGYGLIGFLPLDVQSQDMMTRLTQQIDDCIGNFL